MPEPVLRIEVPGRAVSANARLGYNRRAGRTFLTQQARDWKDTVAYYAFVAWAMGLARNNAPVTPPLRIVCHVYGVRGDADNYAKLLLDGLKAGIGIDDSEFRSVTIDATAKGLKAPKAVIEVYEMAAEEAA